MGEPRGTEQLWKTLFFGLLGLTSFVVLIVITLILWPVPKEDVPQKEFIEDEDGAEFTIHSSKSNLNELVNGYVDKLMKDDGDKYSVQLNDDVQLNGSIKAFDSEIPITIRLEPIVQENGDLILKQKEISLGLLHLPNKRVLKYLKDNLPVPEWVTINPNEEDIYIAVTQMDIRSNFKVRIQQFDLENDQLSFRIKVPNETLGL
ncbi:YpmS family protein [Aquibacillus sediminis]|uniref:YpmS family protein n=1 Tax=Aquibacillus sediminis TaxID=2574734 RepID=UPI00110805AE|nr:YpmS family protein [Aquibacillus sediminis]